MSLYFQRRSYVLSLKVWYDNFNLLTCENNNVKYFKILMKHMNNENVKKSFITRESEMLVEPASFRKE